MKPTMKYDEDANALYIKLENNRKVAWTNPVNLLSGTMGVEINIDYDVDGNPVGIEILL